MAEKLGTDESNIDIPALKDSHPNEAGVGAINTVLTANGVPARPT
jgi:hypothetical protein